ncbi:MAG: hypothetical protein ACRBBO_03270 [Cognatishimia sp.]
MSSTDDKPLAVFLAPLIVFPFFVAGMGFQYSDQETQLDLVRRCIVAAGISIPLLNLSGWPSVHGQKLLYRLAFGLQNGLWFSLAMILVKAPEYTTASASLVMLITGAVFGGLQMIGFRNIEPQLLRNAENLSKVILNLLLAWACFFAMLHTFGDITDAAMVAIAVVALQPQLVLDDLSATRRRYKFIGFFIILTAFLACKIAPAFIGAT